MERVDRLRLDIRFDGGDIGKKRGPGILLRVCKFPGMYCQPFYLLQWRRL